MRRKFDGVIEAIRYAPDGQIALARMYERRGAVWSDHFLLDREHLAARLTAGGRLVTGRRNPYFGNTFETGNLVILMDGHIISEGKPTSRDHVAGIPLF